MYCGQKWVYFIDQLLQLSLGSTHISYKLGCHVYYLARIYQRTYLTVEPFSTKKLFEFRCFISECSLTFAACLVNVMRTRDTDKEALVKLKAVELLVTSGFEGFSTNKLAKLCNMSVATLYIYYKDKDDLIVQIGREEVRKMRQAVSEGFQAELSLEEGLRTQWKNRYHYLINNTLISSFFEQLRTSSYQDLIYSGFRDDEGNRLSQFVDQVIVREEIKPMPMEVFWSVAFSPLHTLIRAHHEGQRATGKLFTLTEPLLWQAFDLVLKGLK